MTPVESECLQDHFLKVEYCSTVCESDRKVYIKKLEMVQHMTARYTVHQYQNTSSVVEMVAHLNGIPLAICHECTRLAMIRHVNPGMMYKMMNDLVAVHHQQYLLLPMHSMIVELPAYGLYSVTVLPKEMTGLHVDLPSLFLSLHVHYCT